MKRVGLAAVVAAVATLAATPASAVVAMDQTLYFHGTCSDCTLNSAPGQPMATLVLRAGYQLGSALAVDDIVSFSYVGSNLVDPYTWTGPAGVPVEQLADIYGAAGSAGPGTQALRMDAIDGLGFMTDRSGQWWTCASGPSGFYSGSCDALRNNDFGTGSWSSAAVVPEPSAMALMALGLAAVGGLAARRRPAA